MERCLATGPRSSKPGSGSTPTAGNAGPPTSPTPPAREPSSQAVEVKKRKKIRRGSGGIRTHFKDCDNVVNKWKIFHLNIRGFKSRSNSLQSIVQGLDVDIVTLNEHGRKNKQKMKMGGFKSYMKNRFNQGGIITRILASWHHVVL